MVQAEQSSGFVVSEGIFMTYHRAREELPRVFRYVYVPASWPSLSRSALFNEE